jgi:hypothetical protein
VGKIRHPRIARAGLLKVQHDLPGVVHEDAGLVGITLEPQRGSTTKPRVSEAAESSSATLGYRPPTDRVNPEGVVQAARILRLYRPR